MQGEVLSWVDGLLGLMIAMPKSRSSSTNPAASEFTSAGNDLPVTGVAVDLAVSVCIHPVPVPLIPTKACTFAAPTVMKPTSLTASMKGIGVSAGSPYLLKSSLTSLVTSPRSPR